MSTPNRNMLVPNMTLDEVLAAVDAIVDEVGEAYVYPDAERFPTKYVGDPGKGMCRYTTDAGTGSCFVGRWIEKVSPATFGVLHDYEMDGNNLGGVLTVVNTYLPQQGIVLDDDGMTVLEILQNRQDREQSYGQARADVQRFVDARKAYLADPENVVPVNNDQYI